MNANSAHHTTDETALRIEQEWAQLRPYLREPGKEAPPGMYLLLLHGRRDPGEQMFNWGFDGPNIGPLEYFHTTYGSHAHYATADGLVMSGGPSDVITFDKTGLLVLASPSTTRYFGDWSVYHHKGGTL
jgi:hypothetical protein